MNSFTKQGKIVVVGGLTLIFVIVLGIYWWQRGDARLVQPASEQQDIIKNRATNALKSVADIANELSGITEGAIFNFEIVDTDGRSANFGVWKTDTGERLAEERMVRFKEVGSPQNVSEIDSITNRVIAMHRSAANSGGQHSADELEKTARLFLEKVDPNFVELEPTLVFDPTSKTNPQGSNYFFRWNDLYYRKGLPAGVEIDIDPFIQVGITQGGFIFSYDNTISNYRQVKLSSATDCSNGCDVCPVGHIAYEDCIGSIGKKEKDPNMKWYYNP